MPPPSLGYGVEFSITLFKVRHALQARSQNSHQKNQNSNKNTYIVIFLTYQSTGPQKRNNRYCSHFMITSRKYKITVVIADKHSQLTISLQKAFNQNENIHQFQAKRGGLIIEFLFTSLREFELK